MEGVGPVKLLDTRIPDVRLIRMNRIGDDRGFFARAFDREVFQAHGMDPAIAQINVSRSQHVGTLRGLHFQRAPRDEAKLVRCVRGRIFDVALDMRPDSPTYLQHVGAELTADEGQALYVPRGFAHAYLTLCDDTEVLYSASEPYSPELESGVRHDDPAIAIDWPVPVVHVSDKDRAWPLLGSGTDDDRQG